MTKRRNFDQWTKDVLWDDLEKCGCNTIGCHYNSHRLCTNCKKPIYRCAYIYKQPRSKFAWIIDHKKNLKSEDNLNSIKNLRIICIVCKKEKDPKPQFGK